VKWWFLRPAGSVLVFAIVNFRESEDLDGAFQVVIVVVTLGRDETLCKTWKLTAMAWMMDGILVRPQRRDYVPLQPPSIAAILIPASPQALAATPAMPPNDLEADRALQH
jgi:hypothetical protein